jgi:hypothetical protein
MAAQRLPYAPPPSLEDVSEGGDYDDLPSDMELDFNSDISSIDRFGDATDRWNDAPEAA